MTTTSYKEITCYADMEKFIIQEIRIQTQSRAFAEIKLEDKFFFKLLKLVQFILKDKEKERWARIELGEDVKKFQVRINRVKTIVSR